VANTFILGGESHCYITIDSGSRRLYIPHGTKVDVIDADGGTNIGEVADTPGVHGVALAPEFRKGFTSNGKADTVTIFDLQTFAHTAEIKTGKKPDAIIDDSGLHRVFVSNGDSNDITVIDAASGRVAGTVPLGGAPEYAASDNQGTRG
jgi:YVTN family beta-propeller protein